VAQQLLNVAYVVSSAESVAGGQRVASGQGFHVYRLAVTGERAWLVYAATVEPDDGKALRQLATGALDVRRSALLASPPPVTLTGSGQGSVLVAGRSPGNMTLDVESDAPAILVLSEIAYPGWRATLDGRSVPLLRADTILRAVAVPPGAHRVEMVFDPPSVKLGALVTLVSLVVLASLLGRGRRARGAQT
jgi:hypothetical protein